MTEIKIAIVAGEHSGDILGADLMSALCDLAAKNGVTISFKGVAGPKMQALGATSLFDMDELSVMGLLEILKRLPRLLKKRKKLAADIIDWTPDLFIGIDAPEFNLGLELMLKDQGLKTVHYVSPSVWAWRQSRIHTIKKACDLVLALLPFEQTFYQKHNMPCEFVGHTMADQIPLADQQTVLRQQLGLEQSQPILGVLPGSRGSEIKFLLKPFLAAARELTKTLPELLILIPAVNDYRAQAMQHVIDSEFTDLNIKLSVGNARDVMGASNAVLLASGTATLETMLMKTPMVAGYQVSWLSYQVFSRMVKTPFFTLPNLLAGREIVPELIQHEMTVDNMVAHLLPMLTEPQTELKQTFHQIHSDIQRNASQRAAEAIWPLLSQNASLETRERT